MTPLLELPAPRRELAERAFEFCDQQWDEERGLVWAPPGSGFGDVHLLPGSAWYAYGLLMRGERQRAVRCLEAVLGLQYDVPGTPWHGTFAQFAETPEPEDGAVMWIDFDPNWRQFIGTTLVLIEKDFGPVVDTSRALRLAIDGEPDGRVPVSYSNITLMKAWLEAEAGDRSEGEALAREVTELYFENGAFDEYNSPTYYGIDFYALALWTTRSSSAVLKDLGDRLEEALWTDIAEWYHAPMGNLCGPYSRTYGMDQARYLSALGLWIANETGPAAAPLPGFTADVAHGHDYFLAPVAAALGSRIPAAAELTAFTGARLIGQQLGDDRIASGWIGDTVMIGGEVNPGEPVSNPSQAYPATIHWQRPDGDVDWLAVRSRGPIDSVAHEGRLEVRWPAPDSDLQQVRIVVHAPGLDESALDGDEWRLPGLDAVLDHDGLERLWVERMDDRRLRVGYARRGPSRLSLRVEPTA